MFILCGEGSINRNSGVDESAEGGDESGEVGDDSIDIGVGISIKLKEYTIVYFPKHPNTNFFDLRYGREWREQHNFGWQIINRI